METSSETKEIASALTKFRQLVGNVSKDSVNPFFKSKYASLENVVETIKPALDQCNLTFAQFPDGDGLTTLIIHGGGQWIKATAKLIVKDQTPQGLGSAITYMRRYALSAALGLATEDDDDGNGAPVAPKQALGAKQAPKIDYPQPTPNTDASGLPEAKEVTKMKAAKDRIKFQLNRLGHKAGNLAEVAASVSYELDMDISEAKDLASLEGIGQLLADKAAKK